MSRKAIARRSVVTAALAAATPLAGRLGAAGAWPTKPIRIVVPFNPGGAIDALVRVIADGLTARLGQQVLVDPKPGANTIVGSEIVAKAAPDGYTFLITTNSTHTNNPTLYAKLPFDPAKDLIPVSLVSLGTILVVVKADAPFSDLRGMATWVEGAGPARHLRQLGHRLERPSLRPDVRAGAGRRTTATCLIAATCRPCRTSPNGTLDLTWASPTSAKPQIDAGRVKPLAVAGLQALGLDAAAADLRRAARRRLRPQPVRRGLCAGRNAGRHRRSPVSARSKP